MNSGDYMIKIKNAKLRKILNYLSRVFSYTILGFLLFVGMFLVIYIITGKISHSKGENPMMGLFTIISPSMTDTINVYDVVFTKKVDPDDLEIGDVITFYSTNNYFKGTPITHRLVDIVEVPGTGKMFVTKGDANKKADAEKVYPENVLGKVIFKIPQLGRVQFFLASKGGWLVAILIPALAIISYDIYKVFKLIVLKSKMIELRKKNGNI